MQARISVPSTMSGIKLVLKICVWFNEYTNASNSVALQNSNSNFALLQHMELLGQTVMSEASQLQRRTGV